MADSQFSLQWNYHNKNICHGLSSLQQSGEFVDMTLAADGHHVKVHQMVLALASPYIKELIATANCPHPVIFLNQVSYKTLCSILEYIYMGQALVSVNDINELLIAAKELQIKGLKDVDMTQTHNESRMTGIEMKLQQLDTPTPPEVIPLSTLKQKRNIDNNSSNNIFGIPPRKRISLDISAENTKETMDNDFERTVPINSEFSDDLDHDDYNNDDDIGDETVADKTPSVGNQRSDLMQYSVSRHGVLKLIMNRYVYSIDYRYSDGRRKWRCTDRNFKCKAVVITKNNVVVRRLFNHNHKYHDKRIMRLVLAGNVFGALPDAEKRKQIVAEKPCEPDTSLAKDNQRDSSGGPGDETETGDTVLPATPLPVSTSAMSKVVIKVPRLPETKGSTAFLAKGSDKRTDRDSTRRVETPHKRRAKVLKPREGRAIVVSSVSEARTETYSRSGKPPKKQDMPVI